MITKGQIQELDRQRESDNILEVIPPLLELVGSVVAVAPAPPEKFMLGGLRDGRLRVSEPIAVAHIVEGDGYVVEAPELNEFGFGNNLSEAIQDLQAAIAELYLTLEAEQGRLGPDLESVWDVLSQKVRKADAISRS